MGVARLRRESCQQYRQAAGAVAEALIGADWTRHHATTDSTLAVFRGRAAWIVCGCILTRKPKRKLPTLWAAAPEHQPGCFALEEEEGGHWMGTAVPVVKEARPTL